MSKEEEKLLQPAAAFQALPLNHMIAEPLKAAIQAQQQAAIALQDYLQMFIDEETNKPITVDFNASLKDESGEERSVGISAPMLSIVPVPHLTIKELTTNFVFEVSHIRKESNVKEGSLKGSASAQGIVSKFVDFSLSGSASSKSTVESTANQSGTLNITVRAEEAPMPAGLKKVLDIMTSAITSGPVHTAKPSNG